MSSDGTVDPDPVLARTVSGAGGAGADDLPHPARVSGKSFAPPRA